MNRPFTYKRTSAWPLKKHTRNALERDLFKIKGFRKWEIWTVWDQCYYKNWIHARASLCVTPACDDWDRDLLCVCWHQIVKGFCLLQGQACPASRHQCTMIVMAMECEWQAGSHVVAGEQEARNAPVSDISLSFIKTLHAFGSTHSLFRSFPFHHLSLSLSRSLFVPLSVPLFSLSSSGMNLKRISVCVGVMLLFYAPYHTQTNKNEWISVHKHDVIQT